MQQELLRKEIDKMQEESVAEPVAIEWASPIVLVLKEDESLRFCVDYRRLNVVKERSSYPILRMVECINSLSEVQIFPAFDSNSGYW